VAARVSREIWVLGSTQGVDFVTTGGAIMFFFRRNIIYRVAVEELIGIFLVQWWIITQSGNFSIVHQFIHFKCGSPPGS